MRVRKLYRSTRSDKAKASAEEEEAALGSFRVLACSKKESVPKFPRLHSSSSSTALTHGVFSARRTRHIEHATDRMSGLPAYSVDASSVEAVATKEYVATIQPTITIRYVQQCLLLRESSVLQRVVGVAVVCWRGVHG